MVAAAFPAAADEYTTAAPLAPAHTDWLRNVLAVTGPLEDMERFRAAAADAGVIPWGLDFDGMQEDWFLSLVAPPEGARAISVQGARILTRRLRDATAHNHQQAMARIGVDRSCPFDLHALLPIPPSILRLGPDDPASRLWLWSHWGTTRALRHVRALDPVMDGRKRQMAELRVEFWSADWSPWQAVRQLRRTWPALSFDLQPDYAGGDGDEPAGTAVAFAQKQNAPISSRAKAVRKARARRG